MDLTYCHKCKRKASVVPDGKIYKNGWCRDCGRAYQKGRNAKLRGASNDFLPTAAQTCIFCANYFDDPNEFLRITNPHESDEVVAMPCSTCNGHLKRLHQLFMGTIRNTDAVVRMAQLIAMHPQLRFHEKTDATTGLTSMEAFMAQAAEYNRQYEARTEPTQEELLQKILDEEAAAGIDHEASPPEEEYVVKRYGPPTPEQLVEFDKGSTFDHLVD